VIRLGLLIPGVMSCTAHHKSQIDALRAPDQALFNDWLEETELETTYAELVAHLEQAGVGQVVQPWQLLRQGTDWEAVQHAPFAMPPREQWDRIVPTLIFIRDHLEPELGPLEVVSAYRSEAFNEAAGGSANSRHKFFEAVDIVPSQRSRRGALHRELRDIHTEFGTDSSVGLGLYENTRFHVDTWKFRSW